MQKRMKVLFFTVGIAPTVEEKEKASKIDARLVCFRSAGLIDETGSYEDCDAVEGAVPKLYASKFPSYADAVNSVKEKEKCLSEKSDVPVPPAKTTGFGKPKQWGQ